MSTVVRIDISPSSHPDLIQGTSPGAVVGRGALESMYTAFGKINDTAEKVRDKPRLAAAVQPFAERAISHAGRAIDTLTAQVKSLSKQITEKITPGVEPSMGVSIRDYWAQHDGPKALMGIKAAIDANDITTVSALFRAPAYLSGLTEKNYTVLRDVAAQHFAGEQVIHLAEARAALGNVETALSDFTEKVGAHLASWKDDDARILEKELK